MKTISTYPMNHQSDICIDVTLMIEFDTKPVLNQKGFIRIYDYDTDELVDELDLSIPSGPTAPRKIRRLDILQATDIRVKTSRIRIRRPGVYPWNTGVLRILIS